MGDVGGNDSKTTFSGKYLRGERIVRAMITYLMQNEGLGKNTGDLVVFGGYSASARCAMVHLDHVAQILILKGLKVIGLLDCPLFLDLETINKIAFGLNQLMA